MNNVRTDMDELAEAQQSEDSPLDYSKFVSHWKGEISRGTIAQYMYYLNYVDFELNEENIKAFGEWAIQKSKQEFGESDEDRNKRYRMRYYTYLALKKYLKAIQPHLTQHLPPTQEVTKPRIGKKDTRYSRDQVERLVNQASNQKLELSIILMAYSGLRSYELLHLQPSWLEFKQDRIEIEIPPQYAKGDRKNAESQYCYLKPIYEDQIKNYIKSCYDQYESFSNLTERIAEDEVDDKHVFNFIDDSEKTFQDLARERYWLNEKLKDVGEKSGVNKAEKLTSHRLRASFIEFIQDSTKDIAKTKNLARHKNIETTGRYLESSEKEKIETYQKAFE